MSKYQKALENIGMTVIDSLSNGYDSPKYVKDFCYGDYNILQELVDKATPKKPIYKDDLFVSKRHLFCAHCGSRLSNSYNFIDRTMYTYCPYCGGKQDWSGEE